MIKFFKIVDFDDTYQKLNKINITMFVKFYVFEMFKKIIRKFYYFFKIFKLTIRLSKKILYESFIFKHKIINLLKNFNMNEHLKFFINLFNHKNLIKFINFYYL